LNIDTYNRKLIFSPCNDETQSQLSLTIDDISTALIIEHHQYREFEALKRENTLAHENQQIYCETLESKHYNLIHLAAHDSLMAAKSAKLRNCHYLTPIGTKLIAN